MRFTSIIFDCSFLCRIIRFLELLDGGSIQGSSWELPSQVALTSQSSLFCCCVQKMMASFLRYHGVLSIPHFIWTFFCLRHYCPYPTQFWFHSQKFCLSLEPCLGRDPWLVIFKSLSGYIAAVPSITNAGLSHSLVEWTKPLSSSAALSTFCLLCFPVNTTWLFWGSPVLRSINHPIASSASSYTDLDNMMVL